MIQTCVQLEKSYLLQCYKTHIWSNAYIFASNLATRIIQGLNVTHLSVLVCRKIKKQNFNFMCFSPIGICLIFNGRINGHFSQRFVMNALCVSFTGNRILDLGYISSVSSIGLLGVKVALNLK